MGYSIYIDNDLEGYGIPTVELCSPSEDKKKEGYVAYNMSYTKEKGKAGSCTFTVPMFNPEYDSIFVLKSNVTVFNASNGQCVWFGRVLTIDIDFNGNKKVMCEGCLAFFKDILIKPFYYPPTKIEVETPTGTEEQEICGTTINNHLINIMSMYHARCSNSRDMDLMWSSTEDSYMDDIKKACVYGVESYTTILDELEHVCSYDESLVLDSVYDSGYPQAQLAVYPLKTYPGKIRVGENVIDCSNSNDGSDIYSSLILIDDQKRAAYFEVEPDEGAAEGAHVYDYHYDHSGLISEYGVIERVISLGSTINVTSIEESMDTAMTIMDAEAQRLKPALHVTALDLGLLPADYSKWFHPDMAVGVEAIDIGTAVEFEFEQVNLSGTYVCTSLNVNMDDPEDSSYVLEPIESFPSAHTKATPKNDDSTVGHGIGKGGISDAIASNHRKIADGELSVPRTPNEYMFTEDHDDYEPYIWGPEEEHPPIEGETFDTIAAGIDINGDVSYWSIGMVNRDTDDEEFTRLIRPDGTVIRLTDWE
jgi:hypothetical protein